MSGRIDAERIIARWDWRMIHPPQGAIALRRRGAPDADDQVRALGEYAPPPLDEIAQNSELFGDQQRGAIGDACRKIRQEL